MDQAESLLIRLHFGTVRLPVYAVYPSVAFLCTLFAGWACSFRGGPTELQARTERKCIQRSGQAASRKRTFGFLIWDSDPVSRLLTFQRHESKLRRLAVSLKNGAAKNGAAILRSRMPLKQNHAIASAWVSCRLPRANSLPGMKSSPNWDAAGWALFIRRGSFPCSGSSR